MAETDIYQNDREGIFISNSRAIFSETTYEIANITSVSNNQTSISMKDWPVYYRPLVIFATAFLFIIVGNVMISRAVGVFSLIGIFIAWFGFFLQIWTFPKVATALRTRDKIGFAITLVTYSGLRRAIVTQDEALAKEVCDALNEAMFQRG